MAGASGFRGASADAVASLRSDLSASGAQAGSAAGELFSVAQTLRAEGAMRRFVTDATIPTEARTGLVAEVLGSRIGETAKALVTAAVRHRWTVARDLPDALEQLSVEAAVRGVGSDDARLSDELFSVAQLIGANSDLRNALSDPARSVADKESLVENLLGGKALPTTVTLTKQALSGSYRTVVAALEAYQSLAAQARGQRVATVRVANELSEADERRLASALARQYGTEVHLNVLVDPRVLGGIKVEIGDDVIDGTVSAKLDEARRGLAS